MRRAVVPSARGAGCCWQPRSARHTRRAGGRLPAAATPHGWFDPLVACTIETPFPALAGTDGYPFISP